MFVSNETETSRVRWEPCDIPPADCFDYMFDDYVKEIERGEHLWLNAVVEEVCPECGQWVAKESIGGIDAPHGADLDQLARDHGLVEG